MNLLAARSRLCKADFCKCSDFLVLIFLRFSRSTELAAELQRRCVGDMMKYELEVHTNEAPRASLPSSRDRLRAPSCGPATLCPSGTSLRILAPTRVGSVRFTGPKAFSLATPKPTGGTEPPGAVQLGAPPAARRGYDARSCGRSCPRRKRRPGRSRDLLRKCAHFLRQAHLLAIAAGS